MSLAAFTQIVLQVQIIIQRLGLFGPLGESLLLLGVPTTTDRWQMVTVPYVADGPAWVVLAHAQPASAWLAPALAAETVTVHVQAHSGPAHATLVTDPAEQQRLLTVFQHQRARQFPQLFRVALTASPAQLARALAARQLVRLEPHASHPASAG